MKKLFIFSILGILAGCGKDDVKETSFSLEGKHISVQGTAESASVKPTLEAVTRIAVNDLEG